VLTLHPPAPSGQQPEAVVEPVGDLTWCEVADACRGELDRERDPVEPATDLDDRVEAVGRDAERRTRSDSTRDEERNGFGRLGPRLGRRERQRRDRPHMFAVDAKRLARRREDRRVRGLGDHPVHDLRTCVDEVLAVVEDDERRP
jgi:hypothetical protein